jgi:hypothetical protein
MARTRTPIVEVTAADGTTSLWAAIAIPDNEAVAAVKKMIPPGHTAELSLRKLPLGQKLKGTLPGEVIRIQ